MKLISTILVVFALLVTPAFGGGESPQDAAKAIATLFKTKDFERIVKERYTEIYKAEKAGKVDDLVKKFSKRYSNESKLKSMVQFFESLQRIEPTIAKNPAPRVTETDKMAVFQTSKGEYKLYLQKSGKWGFHL